MSAYGNTLDELADRELARVTELAHPASTSTPALHPVDLHSLMLQDWPATRYIFDPIIPRRETTLLGGHGGIGKSMLALTLAAHAACGRQWGPFPAVQCRAAYVSLEDEAATVRYRLRRIIEAYSLPAESIIDALMVFDGADCDAAMVVETMQEGVRRLEPTVGMDRVAAAVKDAGLIVVDNASDAYAGNENERRQVRSFIRLLTGIARENDAGLLLLAHIDKNAAKFGANGNSYSGSTAWHNSVRSRLALLKDDVGCISLAHEKSQFSREAEPIVLAFTGHGVLWPQDARAREAAATQQADADAAAVLTVIRIALKSGATVSIAKRGSATAWHTLCDYPELADEYKTKAGRLRVSAALLRLERDGRVTTETYRDEHRNQRKRYKLTHDASILDPQNARSLPPIPPCVTNARTGGALVTQSALVSTDAKRTHPAPCPDEQTGETVMWDGGATP